MTDKVLSKEWSLSRQESEIDALLCEVLNSFKANYTCESIPFTKTDSVQVELLLRLAARQELVG